MGSIVKKEARVEGGREREEAKVGEDDKDSEREREG